MKRILFDHNVPGPLERFFSAHEVKFADDRGWSKLKNGQLLADAEEHGFDVLLSSNKTMRYEQNMRGRSIGVVVMSDNHWPEVGAYGEAIVQAVEQVKAGEVFSVYCGNFIARRFRKPGMAG